jgi:hypothetical protein
MRLLKLHRPDASGACAAPMAQIKDADQGSRSSLGSGQRSSIQRRRAPWRVRLRIEHAMLDPA